MAALIAPLIARFTVKGTSQTGTWANVFDYQLLAGTETDRAVICESHADLIGAAFASEFGPYMHITSEITEVSWVDLDSADGSTGSVGVGVDGSDSTDVAPTNLSALIRKVAPGGGRAARNGRMYLGNLAEADVGAGTLDAGFRSALQTDANTFLTGTTDPSQPNFGDYSAFMKVVHTTNAGTPSAPNYVYAGDSTVTSMQVDATAATQRRRMRR